MPPIVVKPPASPRPREGDEELTIPQVEQISLFKELSSAPKLQSLPGTVILRHYAKGDVICRQGEPGWTAYYVLKTEDLLELRRGQLQAASNAGKGSLPGQISELENRLTQLKDAAQPDPARKAATVYLAIPEAAGSWRTRLVKRFKNLVANGANNKSKRHPLYIPVDGPADIDYDTREGAIYEGEVLGEMSCLYHTPRSATVVADRDCYALEILRNVLDAMLTNRNKAFKERIDNTYRQRVLQMHLRNVPIFRDLPNDAFEQVQAALASGAELVSLAPGTLICDEHEHADCMYIIRSGFVKVMKHVSALFGEEQVTDWPALCSQLLAGQDQAAPAAHKKVWQLLCAPAQDAVRDPGQAPSRAVIIRALNDLASKPALRNEAEFAEILQSSGLATEAATVPAKPTKWVQHQQVRTFNRLLLAALYPAALTRQSRASAAPQTLAYCSRGDVIGEMGLVAAQPRNATCLAYDHPESKFGEVELVRIGADLFWKVVRGCDALRRNIEQAARQHEESTRAVLAQAVPGQPRPLVLANRFAELGLFQGQRLMLIDLDRCTRCDECVRACVNSHDDHRSRLFLDGPRIDKYLVPATCRQCKDPVCLIGCPVGSIHKGSTGQIVVEDWCIGCTRCAENCPYNAIQMHDLGLIPRSTPGWRFMSASALANQGWWQRDCADRSWPAASTPVRVNRGFKEALPAGSSGQEYCFRYEFALPAYIVKSAGSFHLQVLAPAPGAAVWINGRHIDLKEAMPKGAVKKDKGYEWNLEAVMAAKGSTPAALQAGRNVIAVRVSAPAKTGDVMLELGLYTIHAVEAPLGVSGEFTQEMVMRTAVVCDLCESLPGQEPACVKVCPHDAAMRVDARTEFPG
ncbi:MAG TPA: cyclic nucleotide-binding domain-containing protein [Gemmataceae bacterium]|nr:cyclic nucleotide-binding domain-containing protein [Gemmataceae bacterium]